MQAKVGEGEGRFNWLIGFSLQVSFVSFFLVSVFFSSFSFDAFEMRSGKPYEELVHKYTKEKIDVYMCDENIDETSNVSF